MPRRIPFPFEAQKEDGATPEEIEILSRKKAPTCKSNREPCGNSENL
jgi:hypothetical protein